MTTPTKTHDVNSFCESFGISRSMFYKLQRQNKGPRLMKIGRRTLITSEAAAEWQAQMEGTEANF